MLFAAFQLMFAAITPALITGAFAERKRFGAFVVFTVLWSIFVYSPIAHWVWSADGWLFKLGALDFAGGTVVHISSGVSALIVAILIGKRVIERRQHGAARRADDRPRRRPALVRLVRLQRRLRADRGRPGRERVHRDQHRGRRRDAHLGRRELPAHAARSASSAPPCGASPASSRSRPRRASSARAAPWSSASWPAASATARRCCAARSTVDDALDVFAVHGVGGMFGAVATGVFATSAVQAAYKGLIDGNAGQIGTQLVAVGATIAYAVVATFVIVKLVDVILGIRVPSAQEERRPRPGRPRRGRLPGVTR